MNNQRNLKNDFENIGDWDMERETANSALVKFLQEVHAKHEKHIHTMLKELHADQEGRLATMVDYVVRQAIEEVASRSFPSSSHNGLCSPSPHSSHSAPAANGSTADGMIFNVHNEYVSKKELDEDEDEAKKGMPKVSLVQSVNNVSEQLSSVANLARGDSMFNQYKEGSLRQKTANIVNHPKMDYVVAFFIFANSMIIAAQTEVAAQNIHDEQPPVFRIFDVIFTIFFSFELCARIFVERNRFILGRNKGWNFFDSLVVSSAVIEEFLSASTNTTAVRILRIMRLVRVMRVIRTLRIFNDLRALVHGVINSILSLVWALVLLVVICFINSIFITQVVTTYRRQQHDRPIPDLDYEELDNNFGSLAKTLYSLYKAITGGDDWSRFGDPLFDISTIMGLFFCFYISFAVFAVLNVVTGVFVDNAIKASRSDADVIIMEQNDHRKKHINEMRRVFKKADSDNSGCLNFEEFRKHLEDPCVQAYFRQLDIEVEGQGAVALFGMLDFDDTGQIDVDEFIFGCGQLKGYAKSVDLARMGHGQRKMSNRLLSLITEQNGRLDLLNQRFSSISTQLKDSQQMQRKPEGKLGQLPPPPEGTKPGTLGVAQDHNQDVFTHHPQGSYSAPSTASDKPRERAFRPLRVIE